MNLNGDASYPFVGILLGIIMAGLLNLTTGEHVVQ